MKAADRTDINIDATNMKYIVTETQDKKLRELNLMKIFMKELLPDIELPLKKVRDVSHHNSGYGSAMHDYTQVNVKYYSTHDMEDDLFTEWDDRNQMQEKWAINGMFEPLYNMFGQESFEEFIKWYFDIDITDKGNKKIDWMFW